MVRLMSRLVRSPSSLLGALPRGGRRAAARRRRRVAQTRRSQIGAAMQISWEVRNRFRLFREERDFLLHADSRRGRSILAAEQTLELQSDGRGWARNIVNRLCIDLAGPRQRALHPRQRQGKLSDADGASGHRSPRPAQVPVGATCAWSFDDGDGRRGNQTLRLRRADQFPRPLRPADRSPPSTSPAGRRAAARRRPRSWCATSSSPGSATPSPPAKAIRTAPIALSDEGFCFRSYLGGAAAQYYRPSRAGYKGGRACEAPDTLQSWQRQSALWLNAACHRSLYSYQTRTALALAVQYPHIAVTYLPLACTGATIADGLFGTAARARMPADRNPASCPGTRATPSSPNCARR